MSNSPGRFEGPSPEALAKRHEFEILYANWHRTRADIYDPTLPEDDKSASIRTNAYDAAERELLTTPSPLPWCVWQKWEVLDRYVTDEAYDAQFTDNRVMVALSAIKADILRFGLKAPE